MRTDYDIKCPDCGEHIMNVASSSIAYGDKLWRDNPTLDRVQEFLFRHQGHVLIFVGENHVEHHVNAETVTGDP